MLPRNAQSQIGLRGVIWGLLRWRWGWGWGGQKRADPIADCANLERDKRPLSSHFAATVQPQCVVKNMDLWIKKLQLVLIIRYGFKENEYIVLMHSKKQYCKYFE